MNEYREWAKEKRLCVNCFQEKALEGRTMCAECLDKHKERCERTRSEKSKEQRRNGKCCYNDMHSIKRAIRRNWIIHSC